ncbi:hypothetical protein [Longimicrobium terrae]|uniref:hypothetical protein n=1 Tax=Longimicrobium terrae TaxID=1639882 RepID=UPI0014765001|nr:hypothetical protein [Longimicrobium terrae]NNC31652.1 hypothetical protein [Longimicrobium terrae]
MRTPVLLGACALLAGGCIADDGSGAVYAPERVIWVRGAGYRHEVFLSRSPVLVPAFAGRAARASTIPKAPAT